MGRKKHGGDGEDGQGDTAAETGNTGNPSMQFPGMADMAAMMGFGGGMMPFQSPAQPPKAKPANDNIPAAFRKKAAAAAPPAENSQVDAVGPPKMGGMPGMPAMPGMPGMPGMMGANNPSMFMAMAAMMSAAGGNMPNIANTPGPDSMMTAAMPPMPVPTAPKKQEEDIDRPRTAFELAKDPDIVELFDHFQIDMRHMDRFCRSMEKRQETFDGDMLKIWELCEHARSPEGMLVSKIKEMEDGIFVGKTVPDKELTNLSKKFKLDKPAESKLSDVLAKYDKERRKEYMEELDSHLSTSARPSAMVMMFLKKLGTGQSLGKPGRVAPGSYAANQQEERKDRGGRRGGDRDRDRSRSRERSRDRDRRDDRRSDRDWDRGRGRDRDERGGDRFDKRDKDYDRRSGKDDGDHERSSW